MTKKKKERAFKSAKAWKQTLFLFNVIQTIIISEENKKKTCTFYKVYTSGSWCGYEIAGVTSKLSLMERAETKRVTN